MRVPPGWLRAVISGLTVVGLVLGVWADLATVFPDAFAVRGAPTLTAVLEVIGIVALPTAAIWIIVYLTILDQRTALTAFQVKLLATANLARAERTGTSGKKN